MQIRKNIQKIDFCSMHKTKKQCFCAVNKTKIVKQLK